MVTTPIEIEEISSGDVEFAFEIPSEDRSIIRRGKKLFHPSPEEIGQLVSCGTGDLALLLDNPDFHLSAFTSAVRLEIKRAWKHSDEPLYPLPRGKVTRYLEWDETEMVMRWLETIGPIAERPIRDVNGEDIEFWRQRARDFFANFLIVDGVLHTRCHEPLLQVTPVGIFLKDFAFYRSHVDYSDVDNLGFPAGHGKWLTDSHPFPADMYEDACAFADAKQWPRGELMTADTLVVHGECTSYGTLLDEELVRVASLFVNVSNFSIEDDGKSKGPPSDPEFVRAVAEVTDAAIRCREGKGDFEELEEAFIVAMSHGERCVLSSNFRQPLQKIVSFARELVARRETLPISPVSVGLSVKP
nr:hypothetical protein [Neorhizobium tomejilense]